jgi:hypothetical protein
VRKLTGLTVLAALGAAAAPTADAAKRIPYKGKTPGGHTVTFTLAKGKLWNFATGVPMTCLPIQGGGAPMTRVEPWATRWVRSPYRGRGGAGPRSASSQRRPSRVWATRSQAKANDPTTPRLPPMGP